MIELYNKINRQIEDEFKNLENNIEYLSIKFFTNSKIKLISGIKKTIYVMGDKKIKQKRIKKKNIY